MPIALGEPALSPYEMDNGAGHLFTMETVKTPLPATGGGAAVTMVAGTVAVGEFVPFVASSASAFVGVCDGVSTGPAAGGTLDVVSAGTASFSTGAPLPSAAARTGGDGASGAGVGLFVDGV